MKAMTKFRIIRIVLATIRRHVDERRHDGYYVVISKRKTVIEVLKLYGMNLKINKID